jgi:hypothetical protein
MGETQKEKTMFSAISWYLVLQRNKADWQAWGINTFSANTLL